jgi:hypothetical protein
MTMAERRKPCVLIVGGGSMGIVVGYHLSLGEAQVTFLVRPHRLEALSRPQILYCYSDNTLKEYTGYNLISDPQDMVGANYDYILITLDGASLTNEVGQRLVKTIGEAVRNTTTKIVIGTVFIDLRSWFLEISGVAPDQVTNGPLAIHAYPTKAVTLPLHPPTDPQLLAQSDLAYIDCLEYAMMVDDSSPAVAKGFAAIYNAGAPSRCGIKTAAEMAVFANPIFSVLAGSDLMDWPSFQEIGNKGELWSLTVAGVRNLEANIR